MKRVLLLANILLTGTFRRDHFTPPIFGYNNHRIGYVDLPGTAEFYII
jgi:hypothetical protein